MIKRLIDILMVTELYDSFKQEGIGPAVLDFAAAMADALTPAERMAFVCLFNWEARDDGEPYAFFEKIMATKAAAVQPIVAKLADATRGTCYDPQLTADLDTIAAALKAAADAATG